MPEDRGNNYEPLGPNEKPGAFHALVGGRVQGVGFRYAAAGEALGLGLNGWVRNTADGGVELWAEGPGEKLELFLSWLRQGPPLSRVDSVDAEAREPKKFSGFRITA